MAFLSLRSGSSLCYCLVSGWLSQPTVLPQAATPKWLPWGCFRMEEGHEGRSSLGLLQPELPSCTTALLPAGASPFQLLTPAHHPCRISWGFLPVSARTSRALESSHISPQPRKVWSQSSAQDWGSSWPGRLYLPPCSRIMLTAKPNLHLCFKEAFKHLKNTLKTGDGLVPN